MTLPLYINLSKVVLKTIVASTKVISTKEIEKKVADALKLSPEERTAIHKGKQTKLHNRVVWACYSLKIKGYAENEGKGMYIATNKGIAYSSILK
jgi:restriction endonuclease Mrr